MKILRMIIILSKNKLCNLTETVEEKMLFMKTERNQKATIQGSIMTSSKRLRSQLEKMRQTKLVLGFRKNSATTRKIVHRLSTMKGRTRSDWKLIRFLKPTNKTKSVFLSVRMTIILASTPLLQEKKALTDQILQSQKFRMIELSSMKNSTDRSLKFNNLQLIPNNTVIKKTKIKASLKTHDLSRSMWALTLSKKILPLIHQPRGSWKLKSNLVQFGDRPHPTLPQPRQISLKPQTASNWLTLTKGWPTS